MEVHVYCMADARLMVTGQAQLIRLADDRKAFASDVSDLDRVLPAMFPPGERTCVVIRYGNR